MPTRRSPLVVFSHGIGGSRRGYSYLGRYWAGQGYASLHLQHVGSDRSALGRQPVRAHRPAARRGAGARGDRACPRPAASRSTSCCRRARAAARRRAHRRGRPFLRCQHDAAGGRRTRCSATAAARASRSALPRRDRDLGAAVLRRDRRRRRSCATSTVPTLHVTATEDVIRIPGYYSRRRGPRRGVRRDRQQRARRWRSSPAARTASSPTAPAPAALQLNPQVKAATRELSLAFIGQLQGRAAESFERWIERYRPILARTLSAPLR